MPLTPWVWCAKNAVSLVSVQRPLPSLAIASMLAVVPALCSAQQFNGGKALRSSPGIVEFRQAHFAEAFQDWRNAAEAGDGQSALYLGVMFDTGEGVHQDYGQARSWYEQAAAAGNTVAMFNLAVMKDSGLGSNAPGHGDAAFWYKRASDRGSARAAFNLGLMYETGDGVGQSKVRAAAMFRLAERRGISAAGDHLQSLGEARVPGQPTSKANSDDEFRSAEMELLHRTPGSSERAAQLLRLAADKHNATAEYDLGYCYENGIGVPMNEVLALYWYRAAATDTGDDDLRTIANASASAVSAALPEPNHSAVIEGSHAPHQ